MNDVQIFVEGVTDQKFLQDLIAEWYGITLSIGTTNKLGKILSLGGKMAFGSPETIKKITPLLQQLAIQEIPAVVIFDADIFENNHRYLTTHNFTFFLLPDNQRDGEIETLLEEIICPDNQVIFDCWEAFENCLRGHQTAAK